MRAITPRIFGRKRRPTGRLLLLSKTDGVGPRVKMVGGYKLRFTNVLSTGGATPLDQVPRV